MLRAYIQYTASEITAHYDHRCSQYYNFHNEASSFVKTLIIGQDYLSEELQKFSDGRYMFTGNNPTNMRVEINVGDEEFQLSILQYIQRLLGKRYIPLKNSKMSIHC